MYKFDQNIQNKLSDFEYEFRPEYWEGMEQKLNEASSNTNGSVGKFGKLSGLGSWGNLFIYTSVISLLVTSVYFGIGFHQEDESIADSSYVASENDCGEVNEFNLNIAAEDESLMDENEVEIPKIDSRNVKQLHNNIDDAQLMVDLTITNPMMEIPSIDLEEIAEADTNQSKKSSTEIQKDTYEIPDAQYTTDDHRQDTVAKPTVRVIVKEEKDKRPMQKPKKKVFKKRKGILYYLGIRR